MDWSIVFSAGSLILCVVFFLYFKAYLRRRTGPDRLLAEFREEVNKLIAEIDAATDKDALLVEERIKTLRGILEEVDKRIGVHLRELDRKRFQEEAYAELGRKRSIIGAGQSLPQKTPKAADMFPVSAKTLPEIVPFPESPPETPPQTSRRFASEPASRRAEPANQRAEPASQRAELANQRTEPANQRTEPASQQAEPANQRAEPAGPKIIIPEKQLEPKSLPIREQILDLSRAGLDARLIALRLGISIAEAETAIAIAENL
jgi:hypothetical protein